jgi:hypothetical protein
VALRSVALRSWVDWVPEERGPLDFGRFAYQRELYDERSAGDREQVFAKATQVGLSTLAIRLALYHADIYGRTVLYVFPTSSELGAFAQHRIRPVVRASEHLQSRMPPSAIDNVALRQVGAGYVFFRGAQKPIDSIAADLAIFDEYDFCHMAHIEASERRVSGPLSAGMLRRIGVPTYPGFGISAAFEASDQRAWSVKCEACNEWNRLYGYDAFLANVDQERLELVCRGCRRRLDVQAGEWVAAFPDRDVRGYHVPKLVIPNARLDELVANSRKTRPDQREAFFQRDLGEPFASEENRLSLEQIRGCVDPALRPLASLASDRFVLAGIDVASSRALSVVIGEALEDGSTRRVFVGEIDDEPGRGVFEQLCDLMGRFGVHMAAIDHAPDGRFSQAFAARFPGRVYRVGYFSPGPGQRRESSHWNVDDEVGFASLWRTRWIDVTFEQFRSGSVVLPPLETLPASYPPQLGSLVRRSEETGNGGIRIDYVSTGADDFAHAEVYLLAAHELLLRRAGMQMLAASTATPLALTETIEDFEPVDLTSYGLLDG